MLKLHTLYNILACTFAVLLWCITPFFVQSLQAQTRKVMNRPYIDQRILHYGFLAGVHMQDIELVNNGFTDEMGNQWFADVPNYEPGFSVGVLAEARLSNQRQYQTLKSTYISVPVDLKISAERFNNYRPYVVAGVNPMLDLTVKKGRNLLTNRFDCYLELGFGCDFYYSFFKFIPEIKFAYGLTNIINGLRDDITDPSSLIFSKSVDKGHSKMIIISLYFE